MNEVLASIAILLIVSFTIFWILQFFRCIRIRIQRFLINKINEPFAFHKKHPWLSAILELDTWFDLPKQIEEGKKVGHSSIDKEPKEANSDINMSRSILRGLVACENEDDSSFQVKYPNRGNILDASENNEDSLNFGARNLKSHYG